MSVESDDIASEFYLDSFDLYQPNHTTAGAAITYTLIESATACNWHETPNFDDPQGGVTLLKSQGVMQSDYVMCGLSSQVDAEWIVYLTSRNGRSDWFKVAGEVKTRNLLNYKRFYVTPLGDAPLII